MKTTTCDRCRQPLGENERAVNEALLGSGDTCPTCVRTAKRVIASIDWTKERETQATLDVSPSPVVRSATSTPLRDAQIAGRAAAVERAKQKAAAAKVAKEADAAAKTIETVSPDDVGIVPASIMKGGGK